MAEQISQPATEAAEQVDPLEQLAAELETGDPSRLEALVYDLPSGEMARAVSRLDEADRARLLTLMSPQAAAFLVSELADPQAAAILDELSAEQAAAILDELPSDAQADVLGELRRRDAEQIIAQMEPQEAIDARLLTKYAPDTAGGVMITEYLAFFESMTVGDLLQDLQTNAQQYKRYDVQYVYVITSKGELEGVVQLRDLVLTPADTKIESIMIREPLSVSTGASLDELDEFFDAHRFYAVPVVNEQKQLVGVVRQAMVQEALGERADRTLLRFGGIIAGEEMRSMPVWSRAGRRLVFLTPNIFLNLIAVSVIAVFEPTIAAVPALAIFLPILSDMSGCSGNQAVAVSMRELSLGLVKPAELVRTLAKEAGVGVINGIVLGVLLMGIAYLMKGGEYPLLGLVVGLALAINSVVAVSLGGTIPLMLKGLKLDPAMASGPILTTITDMFGFLLALVFTTWMLL